MDFIYQIILLLLVYLYCFYLVIYERDYSGLIIIIIRQ